MLDRINEWLEDTILRAKESFENLKAEVELRKAYYEASGSFDGNWVAVGLAVVFILFIIFLAF